MGTPKKCGIIALCEIGIFGFGYGVSVMFPNAPGWIWFIVSGFAFLAAFVVWKWPVTQGFTDRRAERIAQKLWDIATRKQADAILRHYDRVEKEKKDA